MVLQHRTIDFAEELLGVALDAILLHVAGAVPTHHAGFDPAVRARGAVALRFAHGQVVQVARHLRRQCDLVHAVAVALEQARRMPAQRQDLIAVGRLHDAHQGLGVKAVGDDGQFFHRALQPIDAEHVRGTQHGQALGAVVPELGIVRQRVERCQQRGDVAVRVLLLQRGFQLLDQVAKAYRVLLPVGKLPVGRLVQRQAGGFVCAQNPGGLIVAEVGHG